jgi:hypothetical protein
MTRRWTIVIAALLFALGIVLRLPHLGAFLTPDEQRIWTTLTGEFMTALLHQDWAATATSGYPGVTTTWAGSLGLTLQWLFDRPPDVTTLAEMADTLLTTPNRLDMLPWMRLGVALLSAAGIVIVFLLARRLFGDAVALLAASLMVFDPFLLAHTRLLNTDPLLAAALTISWLSLMTAATSGQRRYLALGGTAFGLALLTKTPALLVLPLVIVWVVWQQGHRQSLTADVLRASVFDLTWFGLAAVLTCLILWPALWIAPLATLQRSVEFATVLGQTGHELGNFWLGQPVAGPGVLFYPAVVLWRTTPATLIGLALAMLALVATAVQRLRQGIRHGQLAGLSTAWALVVFVAWFGAAMSLSPKKFDRYLLPIFPAIDVLAAWGWLATVRWIAAGSRTWTAARHAPHLPRFGGKPVSSEGSFTNHSWRWAITTSVLVIVQAVSTASNLPSYLTAYNPLMGGLRTARQVMLVGWGEGLEEAAAFLDQQPGGVEQRVAAWYGHNVFAPFFRGQSYDLYYDLRTSDDLYANDIDAVVTYVNQIQRQLVDPSIAARLKTPVMINQRSGTPLAQVFAWPKPFPHTADQVMGDGLRLLGWGVSQPEPTTRQLVVRLYWDEASAAVGSLAPVLVWLKDTSGEVWATAEQSLELESERIVPGWGDYQALEQTLSLRLPAGLLAGEYRVEMAPQGAPSIGLSSVAIPTSFYDQRTPEDVVAPPTPVVFGNAAQLVGIDLKMDNAVWQIDLLWALLAPSPGTKFFVHGMNGADEIVAQVDGDLAALPDQPMAGWQQGQFARQRVRIEWPVGQGDDRRLYLGLYDPDTGQRLPVTLGGHDLSDARYPLR